MRPLLHPMLVNGRSGDPALYIETLFEKHAILFDLGDISPLCRERSSASTTCSCRMLISTIFSASIAC